jgi:hypothetical protein
MTENWTAVTNSRYWPVVDLGAFTNPPSGERSATVAYPLLVIVGFGNPIQHLDNLIVERMTLLEPADSKANPRVQLEAEAGEHDLAP